MPFLCTIGFFHPRETLEYPSLVQADYFITTVGIQSRCQVFVTFLYQKGFFRVVIGTADAGVLKTTSMDIN